MILTRKIVERTIEDLKEIVIPEGVTNIGKNAFKGYKNLENVVIPEGVTIIEDSSFEGCETLKQINIPDGVTTINDKAFKGCRSLKAITIPDSVSHIGKEAFAYCEHLQNVVFNDNIKIRKIEKRTFEHCKYLNEIKLPDSVKSIEEEAFYQCNFLYKIILPNELEVIGKSAFGFCEFMSKVKFPKSLMEIGECSFQYCGELNFNFPEKLKRIGAFAFDECQLPRGLKVPDTVISIGLGAFCKCQEEVVFPPTLTKVENLELQNVSYRIEYVSQKWVKTMIQLLSVGIHPIPIYDWNEPSQQEIEGLADLFKKKFGREPKVISDITTATKVNKLSAEEVVKNFSVKGFKEALKMSGNCPFVAITALLGAGGDLLHKFPIHISYEMGLSPSNIRSWIRKHPASFELLPKLKGMETDINENMSVSEVKELLVNKRALNDLKNIEFKYNFTFADCKCEIEQTEVKLEHLTAHLLNVSDLRQIILGYDTCCCQHYDGVGETAMIYGLLSSMAGFWVIEDNNEIIKAQAEVWLSSDSQTFVFDNIEFANDKDVSEFEEIIKRWTKECPYPNVVLGMGYTQLTLPCPKCPPPEQPPVKGLKHVYTDTHNCVCLKKDGELTW